MDDYADYLTVEQVAERLGVSKKRVYAMMKAKNKDKRLVATFDEKFARWIVHKDELKRPGIKKRDPGRPKGKPGV